MPTVQQALVALAIIGFVAIFALILAELVFRVRSEDDELSHWFQD